MQRYIANLVYLVRHKWFVFLECCKLGIPWLGVVHDLSKLRLSEFIPYALHFFNTDGTRKQQPNAIDELAFNVAWLLHQRRNKHHWQWYVTIDDRGGELVVLPMPDHYRREMLADWRGAGRAKGNGNDQLEWYTQMRDIIWLHSDTRTWIEKQIGYVSDKGED